MSDPRTTAALPTNDFTSKVAKNVRAVLRARGIEVKHTDILHGIARACGVKDAPTLRALADARLPEPAPPEGAPYFRTRYLVEILAAGAPCTTESLHDLALKCGDGDCVGTIAGLHVEPVSPEAIGDLLAAANADPGYFDDDSGSAAEFTGALEDAPAQADALPDLDQFCVYHVSGRTIPRDGFKGYLHAVECLLAAPSRDAVQALGRELLTTHYTSKSRPDAKVHLYPAGAYDPTLTSNPFRQLVRGLSEALGADMTDDEAPEITPRRVATYLRLSDDAELARLLGPPSAFGWSRATLMAEIAAVAALQGDWDDPILTDLA